MTKGFVMDAERLKQGKTSRFRQIKFRNGGE